MASLVSGLISNNLQWVYRRFLQKLLGKYLDIQDAKLSVQLTSGTTTLENVELLPDALNEAFENTPLVVHRGSIKLLKISLPWRTLLSEPCVLELDGLHLTFLIRDSKPYTQEELSRIRESVGAPDANELYQIFRSRVAAYATALAQDIKSGNDAEGRKTPSRPRSFSDTSQLERPSPSQSEAHTGSADADAAPSLAVVSGLLEDLLERAEMRFSNVHLELIAPGIGSDTSDSGTSSQVPSKACVLGALIENASLGPATGSRRSGNYLDPTQQRRGVGGDRKSSDNDNLARHDSFELHKRLTISGLQMRLCERSYKQGTSVLDCDGNEDEYDVVYDDVILEESRIRLDGSYIHNNADWQPSIIDISSVVSSMTSKFVSTLVNEGEGHSESELAEDNSSHAEMRGNELAGETNVSLRAQLRSFSVFLCPPSLSMLNKLKRKLSASIAVVSERAINARLQRARAREVAFARALLRGMDQQSPETDTSNSMSQFERWAKLLATKEGLLAPVIPHYLLNADLLDGTEFHFNLQKIQAMLVEQQQRRLNLNQTMQQTAQNSPQLLPNPGRSASNSFSGPSRPLLQVPSAGAGSAGTLLTRPPSPTIPMPHQQTKPPLLPRAANSPSPASGVTLQNAPSPVSLIPRMPSSGASSPIAVAPLPPPPPPPPSPPVSLAPSSPSIQPRNRSGSVDSTTHHSVHLKPFMTMEAALQSNDALDAPAHFRMTLDSLPPTPQTTSSSRPRAHSVKSTEMPINWTSTTQGISSEANAAASAAATVILESPLWSISFVFPRLEVFVAEHAEPLPLPSDASNTSAPYSFEQDLLADRFNQRFREMVSSMELSTSNPADALTDHSTSQRYQQRMSRIRGWGTCAAGGRKRYESFDHLYASFTAITIEASQSTYKFSLGVDARGVHVLELLRRVSVEHLPKTSVPANMFRKDITCSTATQETSAHPSNLSNKSTYLTRYQKILARRQQQDHNNPWESTTAPMPRSSSPDPELSSRVPLTHTASVIFSVGTLLAKASAKPGLRIRLLQSAATAEKHSHLFSPVSIPGEESYLTPTHSPHAVDKNRMGLALSARTLVDFQSVSVMFDMGLISRLGDLLREPRVQEDDAPVTGGDDATDVPQVFDTVEDESKDIPQQCITTTSGDPLRLITTSTPPLIPGSPSLASIPPLDLSQLSPGPVARGTSPVPQPPAGIKMHPESMRSQVSLPESRTQVVGHVQDLEFILLMPRNYATPGELNGFKSGAFDIGLQRLLDNLPEDSSQMHLDSRGPIRDEHIRVVCHDLYGTQYPVALKEIIQRHDLDGRISSDNSSDDTVMQSRLRFSSVVVSLAYSMALIREAYLRSSGLAQREISPGWTRLNYVEKSILVVTEASEGANFSEETRSHEEDEVMDISATARPLGSETSSWPLIIISSPITALQSSKQLHREHLTHPKKASFIDSLSSLLDEDICEDAPASFKANVRKTALPGQEVGKSPDTTFWAKYETSMAAKKGRLHREELKAVCESELSVAVTVPICRFDASKFELDLLQELIDLLLIDENNDCYMRKVCIVLPPTKEVKGAETKASNVVLLRASPEIRAQLSNYVDADTMREIERDLSQHAHEMALLAEDESHKRESDQANAHVLDTVTMEGEANPLSSSEPLLCTVSTISVSKRTAANAQASLDVNGITVAKSTTDDAVELSEEIAEFAPAFYPHENEHAEGCHDSALARQPLDQAQSIDTVSQLSRETFDAGQSHASFQSAFELPESEHERALAAVEMLFKHKAQDGAVTSRARQEGEKQPELQLQRHASATSVGLDRLAIRITGDIEKEPSPASAAVGMEPPRTPRRVRESDSNMGDPISPVTTLSPMGLAHRSASTGMPLGGTREQGTSGKAATPAPHQHHIASKSVTTLLRQDSEESQRRGAARALVLSHSRSSLPLTMADSIDASDLSSPKDPLAAQSGSDFSSQFESDGLESIRYVDNQGQLSPSYVTFSSLPGNHYQAVPTTEAPQLAQDQASIWECVFLVPLPRVLASRHESAKQKKCKTTPETETALQSDNRAHHRFSLRLLVHSGAVVIHEAPNSLVFDSAESAKAPGLQDPRTITLDLLQTDLTVLAGVNDVEGACHVNIETRDVILREYSECLYDLVAEKCARELTPPSDTDPDVLRIPTIPNSVLTTKLSLPLVFRLSSFKPAEPEHQLSPEHYAELDQSHDWTSGERVDPVLLEPSASWGGPVLALRILMRPTVEEPCTTNTNHHFDPQETHSEDDRDALPDIVQQTESRPRITRLFVELNSLTWNCDLTSSWFSRLMDLFAPPSCPMLIPLDRHELALMALAAWQGSQTRVGASPITVALTDLCIPNWWSDTTRSANTASSVVEGLHDSTRDTPLERLVEMPKFFVRALASNCAIDFNPRLGFAFQPGRAEQLLLSSLARAVLLISKIGMATELVPQAAKHQLLRKVHSIDPLRINSQLMLGACLEIFSSAVELYLLNESKKPYYAPIYPPSLYVDSPFQFERIPTQCTLVPAASTLTRYPYDRARAQLRLYARADAATIRATRAVAAYAHMMKSSPSNQPSTTSDNIFQQLKARLDSLHSHQLLSKSQTARALIMPATHSTSPPMQDSPALGSDTLSFGYASAIFPKRPRGPFISAETGPWLSHIPLPSKLVTASTNTNPPLTKASRSLLLAAPSTGTLGAFLAERGFARICTLDELGVSISLAPNEVREDTDAIVKGMETNLQVDEEGSQNPQQRTRPTVDLSLILGNMRFFITYDMLEPLAELSQLFVSQISPPTEDQLTEEWSLETAPAALDVLADAAARAVGIQSNELPSDANKSSMPEPATVNSAEVDDPRPRAKPVALPSSSVWPSLVETISTKSGKPSVVAETTTLDRALKERQEVASVMQANVIDQLIQTTDDDWADQEDDEIQAVATMTREEEAEFISMQEAAASIFSFDAQPSNGTVATASGPRELEGKSLNAPAAEDWTRAAALPSSNAKLSLHHLVQFGAWQLEPDETEHDLGSNSTSLREDEKTTLGTNGMTESVLVFGYFGGSDSTTPPSRPSVETITTSQTSKDYQTVGSPLAQPFGTQVTSIEDYFAIPIASAQQRASTPTSSLTNVAAPIMEPRPSLPSTPIAQSPTLSSRPSTPVPLPQQLASPLQKLKGVFEKVIPNSLLGTPPSQHVDASPKVLDSPALSSGKPSSLPPSPVLGPAQSSAIPGPLPQTSVPNRSVNRTHLDSLAHEDRNSQVAALWFLADGRVLDGDELEQAATEAALAGLRWRPPLVIIEDYATAFMNAAEIFTQNDAEEQDGTQQAEDSDYALFSRVPKEFRNDFYLKRGDNEILFYEDLTRSLMSVDKAAEDIETLVELAESKEESGDRLGVLSTAIARKRQLEVHASSDLIGRGVAARAASDGLIKAPASELRLMRLGTLTAEERAPATTIINDQGTTASDQQPPPKMSRVERWPTITFNLAVRMVSLQLLSGRAWMSTPVPCQIPASRPSASGLEKPRESKLTLDDQPTSKVANRQGSILRHDGEDLPSTLPRGPIRMSPTSGHPLRHALVRDEDDSGDQELTTNSELPGNEDKNLAYSISDEAIELIMKQVRSRSCLSPKRYLGIQRLTCFDLPPGAPIVLGLGMDAGLSMALGVQGQEIEAISAPREDVLTTWKSQGLSEAQALVAYGAFQLCKIAAENQMHLHTSRQGLPALLQATSKYGLGTGVDIQRDACRLALTLGKRCIALPSLYRKVTETLDATKHQSTRPAVGNYLSDAVFEDLPDSLVESHPAALHPAHQPGVELRVHGVFMRYHSLPPSSPDDVAAAMGKGASEHVRPNSAQRMPKELVSRLRLIVTTVEIFDHLPKSAFKMLLCWCPTDESDDVDDPNSLNHKPSTHPKKPETLQDHVVHTLVQAGKGTSKLKKLGKRLLKDARATARALVSDQKSAKPVIPVAPRFFHGAQVANQTQSLEVRSESDDASENRSTETTDAIPGPDTVSETKPSTSLLGVRITARNPRADQLSLEMNTFRSYRKSLSAVKGDTKYLPHEEVHLDVTHMAPIKIHLDQDTLLFLIDFFVPFHDGVIATTAQLYASDHMNEDSDGEKSSLSIPSEAQSERFGPAQKVASTIAIGSMQLPRIFISLDYAPKKVNFGKLVRGQFFELLHLFPLDDLCIRLPTTRVRNLVGWEAAFATLLQAWVPILRWQLPRYLSSIRPIQPVVDVATGVRDLVLVPMEQLRKRRRASLPGQDDAAAKEIQQPGGLGTGLAKGAVAFVTGLSRGLLGASALAAGAVGSALKMADSTIGSAAGTNQTFPKDLMAQAQGRNAVSVQRPRVSLTWSEGLERARLELEEAMLVVAKNIVMVPVKEYRRGSTRRAVMAVVKAVPTAVLRPLSGAAEAVADVLSGAHRSLHDSTAHEVDPKVKFKP